MCAYAQGFAEDSLKWWDVSFWAERLREAKYSLNEEELRPYFALPNVSSWWLKEYPGISVVERQTQDAAFCSLVLQCSGDV